MKLRRELNKYHCNWNPHPAITATGWKRCETWSSPIVRQGKITIELNRSENDLRVLINDNGQGFLELIDNKEGFGIRLTKRTHSTYKPTKQIQPDFSEIPKAQWCYVSWNNILRGILKSKLKKWKKSYSICFFLSHLWAFHKMKKVLKEQYLIIAISRQLIMLIYIKQIVKATKDWQPYIFC